MAEMRKLYEAPAGVADRVVMCHPNGQVQFAQQVPITWDDGGAGLPDLAGIGAGSVSDELIIPAGGLLVMPIASLCVATDSDGVSPWFFRFNVEVFLFGGWRNGPTLQWYQDSPGVGDVVVANGDWWSGFPVSTRYRLRVAESSGLGPASAVLGGVWRW